VTALTGVAATSLPPAANRMAESARPDRWFDDPMASAFIAAAEWHPVGDDRPGEIWVVLRTRVFDEYLTSAAGGGCRQVVIVGAGLDSRAFRMSWPPGTRLVEIDHPQTFEFKERVIVAVQPRAACQRIVVPADLAGDWTAALARSDFDVEAPTAWLIEGVLVYMSDESVRGLMEGIARSSPRRSRLALTAGTRPAGAARIGWAIEGPPVAWLASFGWTGRVIDIARCAERYGRPMTAERPVGIIMTAERP
jgi:methyltransferase (TIGR00027 family)